jgi:carbamoyltransferase
VVQSGPTVLGINGPYHELSAAIVRNGEIVAFAEEERFNRHKHAKAALISNADELPRRAIEYCLTAAGVSSRGIDYVAYPFVPDRRKLASRDHTSPGDWGTEEGEARFLGLVNRTPAIVSELLGQEVGERFVWVPHELAHAASAFYPSPFSEAAILSVDGIGESSTALLAHGTGTAIRPIIELEYPTSIGFLWEKLAKFIGLSEYDAPKMMALAAFGEAPAAYHEALARLLYEVDGELFVDNDVVRFRVEDYSGLEQLFGARRPRGELPDGRDAAVANALQRRTEWALLKLIARLVAETGSSNLCLAGGVALNCVAMGRILSEARLDGVFVQPVAHDGGTAFGAALHVAHTMLDVPRGPAMRDAYWGPAFDEAECRAALAGSQLSYERVDDVHRVAAELIADGAIIGWFQGRAEAGPRALGNRSILGDPRRSGTKEFINLKAKHREYYRPFAPAVLEEALGEWFEVPLESASFNFMSIALRARADKRSLIPACLHVDGTSRVQRVSASTNPRFHRLISNFRAITGVPVLLNTSFNGPREPIVLTPQHAIATFLGSHLDYLVLGELLVRRPQASSAERGQ